MVEECSTVETYETPLDRFHRTASTLWHRLRIHSIRCLSTWNPAERLNRLGDDFRQVSASTEQEAGYDGLVQEDESAGEMNAYAPV